MSLSTQISKSDKQELYKSFLDNKVFKIYEIDEKPRIEKTKYDVNLENITKLYANNSTYAQTLETLILSTLNEKIKNYETISYLQLSLSPIWNFLLGKMQTVTQKHTSITWSAESSRIRHNSTKFGTNSILFIDRLTKDTIGKIRNVFKLCIKNGLKYNTLVVLFYDEDGYEELIKYYKSELYIIPVIHLSFMLNYYETSKLVNDYQVESVKFQQETTYNDVIRILKNEHRNTAKTFNYQSKNVNTTLDDLTFDKYLSKYTQLTEEEKTKVKTYTDKKKNNDKTNNQTVETTTKLSPLAQVKLNKFNTSIESLETITTAFDYSTLMLNLSHATTYDNIMKYIKTIISISNNYNKVTQSDNTSNTTVNFTIVIGIKLLQKLTGSQLLNIIKHKTQHNFNIILDVPSYDVTRITDEYMNISKDIIAKYNLDSLLTIQLDDNIKETITKKQEEDVNKSKHKYSYQSFNSIIDNIILTLSPDTYERFNYDLKQLQKTRCPGIGIILKISSQDLNINNYLSNQRTWNAFNEFIVEEESKANINITGLFIDDRIKLGNFEIQNAIAVINEYSANEIKDKELLLKTKKYKGLTVTMVDETLFINNTTTELLPQYIKHIKLQPMKFKKNNNKTYSKKEQEALDNEDDSLNKDEGDKNKELLEDEDDYSKTNILFNLLSRLTFNNGNSNGTLIDSSNKEVYDKLYTHENGYIKWYNETQATILKLQTPKNTLDHIKEFVVTSISQSFDYINSYFKTK
jgi:hypothetical protein